MQHTHTHSNTQPRLSNSYVFSLIQNSVVLAHILLNPSNMYTQVHMTQFLCVLF